MTIYMLLQALDALLDVSSSSIEQSSSSSNNSLIFKEDGRYRIDQSDTVSTIFCVKAFLLNMIV